MLSSYLGTALEQHFGVSKVKAPMPYGFVGTAVVAVGDSGCTTGG
ncbi:hypothetical protein [Selenomonas sp.]|nr:hypothetical protein [Selenomonas sp.]